MSDDWSGSEEEEQTIVMDNGTHMFRGGFAGDEAPRAVFPTVVGNSQVSAMLKGLSASTYVGDEAVSKKNTLSMVYPMEDGRITDFEAMEEVWRHTFYNELRVAPEEHPILLSYKPMCHNHQKEQMTEIMFESFSVPSLYMTSDASLTLWGSGDKTGMALDCGYQSCICTPVYESYSISRASAKTKASSANIDEYLEKVLMSKHGVTEEVAKENASQIKEKHGTLKQIDQESDKIEAIVLKDGTQVDIQSDLSDACQGLFTPKVFGTNDKGLVKTVTHSLNRLDPELHGVMLSRITLSGGASLIPRLPETLQAELQQAYPDRKVRVIAPPERKYSTWNGGSVLGSLSFFESLVITRSEYDEHGPYVARRKCTA